MKDTIIGVKSTTTFAATNTDWMQACGILVDAFTARLIMNDQFLLDLYYNFVKVNAYV